MKPLLAALIACGLPLCAPAEDANAFINFPANDVFEVLVLYTEIVGRKPGFVELGLRAYVRIVPGKRLTEAAATELIRKTLLERYGIELRTTDDRGHRLFAEELWKCFR